MRHLHWTRRMRARAERVSVYLQVQLRGDAVSPRQSRDSFSTRWFKYDRDKL